MIEYEGAPLLRDQSPINFVVARESQVDLTPKEINILNSIFVTDLTPVTSLLECPDHVHRVVSLRDCKREIASVRLLAC